MSGENTVATALHEGPSKVGLICGKPAGFSASVPRAVALTKFEHDVQTNGGFGPPPPQNGQNPECAEIATQIRVAP